MAPDHSPQARESSNGSSSHPSDKSRDEHKAVSDEKLSNTIDINTGITDAVLSKQNPDVQNDQSSAQPGDGPQNLTRVSTNERPYSTFTLWEKRFIILAASCGSFLSPLTTNIYFPALNTIASSLKVTVSQINLSITTYMIFQGVAPTFVGGFSDSAGRRPAYVIGFIIYIGANIGLALQNNYAALMVLRCLQSAGSSGMTTIASAVVADTITSAERGSYIGYTSVGSVLGPSLSPVLGGILSEYLGWNSIFWFLTIFSTVLFILFLLFFPETCRKVVGDGSVPPYVWNKSLMNYYKERRKIKAGDPPDYAERDALAAKRHIHFPNPLATLKVVFEKEAAIILTFGGIVYAGFYTITTSMSTQFKEIYGLSDLYLGLCFIPISIGTLLAAVTNGKFDPIDGNYRRHAKRLGLPLVKNRYQDLSNFPIERVRLEVGLPLVLLGAATIITYGWVLHFRTNLAGPLILLFFAGFSISGFFKTITILIIDIVPRRAATAAASFNLVRCLLGAGATAVVNPMIKTMGAGWAFTFWGLLWVACCPIMLLVMKSGPQWRKEKNGKEVARKEKRKAKLAQRDIEKQSRKNRSEKIG